VNYLVAKGIDYTIYWSINPESGDTGGLYTTPYDPISNTSGWGTWGALDQTKLTMLAKLWNAPIIPTPTPTPNGSATPTASATATHTASPTPITSATPTASRSASPTATISATPTASRTASPTPTASRTASPTPTASRTASPTPTPTPPPTASGSASGAKCSAAYSITSGWSTGFVANVTVTNTGTVATKTWKVTWTWSGNQTLVNTWNAIVTSSGTAVTAVNEPYNNVIAGGGNTSFGFQGSFSGTNTNPTLTCSAT